MVDTELFAECGVFLIRGEALLSVRGDFGGTSGGIALKSLKVFGFNASIIAPDSLTLGIINGLSSLGTNEIDLFPISLTAKSLLAE